MSYQEMLVALKKFHDQGRVLQLVMVEPRSGNNSPKSKKKKTTSKSKKQKDLSDNN